MILKKMIAKCFAAIKAGPKRMKRGPYKKRAKVTRGDGEFSD